MICDALEHLNRYRGLHRNLDTAIDYLAAYHVAHDLSDLPLGRTEVDGENVFINVMEADLSPDSTRLEYHKKYADLQIDLTGGEGWGYTTLPGEEAGVFVYGRYWFQDQSGCRQRHAGRGAVRPVFPRRAAQARRGTARLCSCAQSGHQDQDGGLMDMEKEKLFEQIKGGLIVSCQALETEPLYTKEGGVMPLMAKAAAMSGAVGIRANTVRDITQIKQVVDLPVIGIIKKDYPGTPMYITVTMKEVDELVACGVDILAVQGTGALRPDGSTSAQFIRAIKAKYPDQLLMADCDNFENAMLCAEAGADFVGTTMRGYTPETQGINDIDFEFVHKLAAECPAKIIAEGHIHYPEQAVKALEAGAFALVVGGAITRPAEITARFTGAINAMHK